MPVDDWRLESPEGLSHTWNLMLAISQDFAGTGPEHLHAAFISGCLAFFHMTGLLAVWWLGSRKQGRSAWHFYELALKAEEHLLPPSSPCGKSPRSLKSKKGHRPCHLMGECQLLPCRMCGVVMVWWPSWGKTYRILPLRGFHEF